MAQAQTLIDRLGRLRTRLAARRAARLPIVPRFAVSPTPHSIGQAQTGRRLIAGELLFAGLRISDPVLSIWDIATDNPAVIAAIHGCGWLDDLAALGNEPARARAQEWVSDWIIRYGDGTGVGWQPQITARRLMAWIDHSDFLLRREPPEAKARFLQSIGQQAAFLAQRWPVTPDGLPRIATLSCVIRTAVLLDPAPVPPAKPVQALLAACQRRIADDGTVASRNPAELAAIFVHLVETVQALAQAKQPVPAGLAAAITRIAPVLRSLRHSDGALARFHGGGAGQAGRIDAALALSGVKTPALTGRAMGYVRLARGRSTVIIDAAAPPVADAARDAHASTLGFELTSGRRPLIVNCGAGALFGAEWHSASRATHSHSTLGLDGVSTAYLAQGILSDAPIDLRCETASGPGGATVDVSHDGYQRSHGLTHARRLHLAQDGRALSGEDLLVALDATDQARFDRVFDQTLHAGLRFTIRFHLHPDVTCTPTTDGQAVTLALKSGEIWFLSHDGAAQLTINPSVYLENGQLKPLAAQQVVLSGSALAYATRVRWTLAKAEDTPLALRDLARRDPTDDTDQI